MAVFELSNKGLMQTTSITIFMTDALMQYKYSNKI